MADNYRTSAKRPCRGIMHVVKRGDTLYKLSRTYNVRVSAIMLANPYMNIYSLQPGDEICIPRVGTTPPQTAVPPIGTAPPQTAVPPIGTAPPQTAVPPIGTAPPQTAVPPISSVPPGGEVISPVPPIGDLKPPTTIQPREALEKMETWKPETLQPEMPEQPDEQPEGDNQAGKYDTIDYEYEKFRASLEPEAQTVRSASVEAMREECQSAGNLEAEITETGSESLKSTSTEDADDVMNEDIGAMFQSLNNNLELFNRYMKKMLDKN